MEDMEDMEDISSSAVVDVLVYSNKGEYLTLLVNEKVQDA